MSFNTQPVPYIYVYKPVHFNSSVYKSMDVTSSNTL